MSDSNLLFAHSLCAPTTTKHNSPLTEGTQQQKILDMLRDNKFSKIAGVARGSYNHKQHNRTYKYSEDEIQWVRNADVTAIAAKYNISKVRAGTFRHQLRTSYVWLPWSRDK